MLVHLDKKLKSERKFFFAQCFGATIYLALMIELVSLQHAAIVSSIAASAFIIFATPKGYYSKPKNIIGGHAVGMLFGALLSFCHTQWGLHMSLAAALAGGLSFLVMVIIDVEHPPAAGTALGIILAGFSFKLALLITISIGTLALFEFFGNRYMKDLI